jgi:hypothetical protein
MKFPRPNNLAYFCVFPIFVSRARAYPSGAPYANA